ncbi:hypothetical protein [Ferrovibrio sp.]|uniref:hypothetical protein n=1 Tax=Ferrovibrio sp. TaxID=1917215 RepID=UPI0035B4AE31
MQKGSEKLQDWVCAAIAANDGQASIVEICKYIWLQHEAELRKDDQFFYTWQYQMRWAGQQLVKKGLIKKTKIGIKAQWILLK